MTTFKKLKKCYALLRMQYRLHYRPIELVYIFTKVSMIKNMFVLRSNISANEHKSNFAVFNWTKKNFPARNILFFPQEYLVQMIL